MSDSTGQGKLTPGPARDAYLRCLQEKNISLKSRPYYVTRVNQFLSAAPNGNPALLNNQDIKRILTAFDRQDNLRDWQFAQLVDAVRIYFTCYLKSQLANTVDWSYWSSSAKAITNSHASTGRNSRPEELLREKVRSGKGSLSKIRQQHEDLVVRVVTEIRARGYAYKTEQVYEQWVCRYIDFCKGIYTHVLNRPGVTVSSPLDL